MSRVITLPPEDQLLADGSKLGGWWREVEDGRLLCELCPRACRLHAGDRGFCFVRENRGGQMVLTTYGRSTGFCIDPIEKKPLNHFYPGTSVLSFGTAGCNLGCKFCQNWDISKSREIERLSELALPDAIVAAAQQWDCRSVAFTYNDPVIWAEYAIDVAKACRAGGVMSVAVTAGYITEQAREPFFQWMDAANVDLKGFTEEFYFHYTLSHLQPVLDTLEWLKRETNVWFEITNLIIPAANDAKDEIRQMCDWIMAHVGDDTPVHFTAFHPDFRLRDRPNTPKETLVMAHDIAVEHGLKHVYIGNVNDWDRQSTYCPNCRQLLIARNWYELGAYNLNQDKCKFCDHTIAGRFDRRPGDWGRKRLPVRIADFAHDSPKNVNTIPLAIPAELSKQKSETKMDGPTSSSESKGNSLTEIASQERPQITAEQQQAIHRAAYQFVVSEITGSRADTNMAEALRGVGELMVEGVFVTLKRAGHLRGCCGVLGPALRLDGALKQSAGRTASHDVRLPPIGVAELPYLDLDVTLLYGFTKLHVPPDQRPKAIQIGRHGLQVRSGERSGLLLPHVAIEHGFDEVQFLRQVCRKAGLPPEAWRDGRTEVVTFEGVMIEGPVAEIQSKPLPERITAPISQQELLQLNDVGRRNTLAIFLGATPTYYVPGVTDRTVAGVGLSLRFSDGKTLRFGQISLRPGVPLQATLFQLTSTAAATLKSHQADPRQVGQLSAAVAVLEEPAMQGTAAQPDLRGLDSRQRALLLLEHQRSTWAYSFNCAPEQLLSELVAHAGVTDPEAAQLYSLAISTSESEWLIGNAPRPQSAPKTRLAAVAGAFYPETASELNQLLDALIPSCDETPSVWPAAMVPHAGLKYSGRVAASVLQRLVLPQDIIIIGPKHTRLGVDWAVAPHDSWSIPGAAIAGNMQLAQRLVNEVPGLKLDAAAHEREHAIEVELPFIARFSPHSRVVGVAVGPCDFDQGLELGNGLARVLSTLNPRPLLLISSDMNHFGSDDENRRLDAMALEAMSQLDPQQLFDVVVGNGITMCGVMPAVIVMQALRQLGGLKSYRQIDYATSGDVSGDTSRVVGYAGVLLG